MLGSCTGTLLSGSPIAAHQIEAFIDSELGIVLRQIWSYQGHTVFRAEPSFAPS